jgi:GNAT superfamily N-acetyltransferase
MLEITPIAPEYRAEALELLFRDHAAEDRRRQVDEMLGALASGDISGGGLLGAFRGARLVGVACAQIQPGRTAAVWPPRIVDAEPDTVAERLLAAAIERLSRADVCLAQALLPLAAEEDEARLRSGGFTHLADLLYLVSLEIEFPTDDVTAPFALEPCEDPGSPRLAAVVDASYDATLDCPLLDGVRRIDDVLDGYRSSGVFEPDLWLISRYQDQDAGCLILADHPRHGNLELVYMGVVPEFRGRGWGGQLARKAQWLARQRGRPRLVLAVDAENQPAIDAYAAVGFQAWDRRRALVKLFRPAPSCSAGKRGRV